MTNKQPAMWVGTLGLIVIGIMLMFGVPLHADEDNAAAEFDAERFEIPELGAIIVDSHDGPRISEVTPVGGRLDKYRDVDMQSGDVVMAANGQRLKSVVALRELLSGLEAGSEVKMAIQRFGSLTVVRFVIANEAERQEAAKMASSYVEMKIEAEGGEPTGHMTGGSMMMKFEAEEGSVPCIELGAILDDTSGQIKVAEIIDLPAAVASPVTLQKGDILTALQGKEVSQSMDLIDMFGELEAGTEVTLNLTRGGEETSLTFKMPKRPGSVRIMKK